MVAIIKLFEIEKEESYDTAVPITVGLMIGTLYLLRKRNLILRTQRL